MRPAAPRVPTRRALHELSIRLARDRHVVEFTRGLIAARPARDRLARIAAAFSFVSTLVNTPAAAGSASRDGVGVLLAIAGKEEGPAVILCAMLQALGERASVVLAPAMPFVRVEIGPQDVRRLPPHARLLAARERFYIPLDPRRARWPMGFLTSPARVGSTMARA
jgi:hypothetical protein